MTISRDALNQILAGGGHFEIHEPGRFGKTNVYRGRNISDFFAKADGRRHEHLVYDARGVLVYHRDISGNVLVGSEYQQHRGRQRQSAVISIREAFQRAMRMYK